MAKNVKAPSADESTSSKPIKERRNKDAKAAKTKSDPKAKGTFWRVNEKSFVDSCSSRIFQKGLENYSSGWLAQGHEVGKPVVLHSWTSYFYFDLSLLGRKISSQAFPQSSKQWGSTVVERLCTCCQAS